jgi:hypothetical protein
MQKSMARKKYYEKWKVLTKEQERGIMRDYKSGIVRNKIMREYGIPQGQFYHIVKGTGVVFKMEEPENLNMSSAANVSRSRVSREGTLRKKHPSPKAEIRM